MEEEKISRGEIRIVSVIGKLLPALVVSSNEYNDESRGPIVAIVSSVVVEFAKQIRVDVDETHGFINCDNVLRVARRNVGRCVARVSRETMREVETNLETLFDLGYADDVETEKLRSEVARLRREVEYGREGILSRAAEVENYKRLYNKAVDQIAEMTLAADVAKRIAEKTAAVEVVPEEPAEEIESEVVAVVEEVAPVEEKVFEEPEEVIVEEPPKSTITFPVWEPPVEKPKAPEPVKKVNVNTANIYDLMAAGFGKSEAGRIARWVRKYGEFKSLDDLTKVDGVTGKLLRKIRDGLEV